MLYRLVRPVLRLAMRVFFRTIEVHGLANVPGGRPLLFAANHPNMAMDPFMIGMIHDRRVHFLGKSTLFAPAPVGWALRSLGVIPVYRRSDDPGQADPTRPEGAAAPPAPFRNRQTFAECTRVLERGEALGIFPEGTSLAAPRLQPLKTGAARIVLEAEAANAFGLGVRVVPVGLNFLERGTFRSDVLVLVGHPIDPSRHFDRYRSDPRAAVDELTDDIEAALAAVTRNLREDQDARFVHRFERLYVEAVRAPLVGETTTLKESFDVDRALLDAYAHYTDTQPATTADLKRRVETYLLALDWLGVTDAGVGAMRRPWAMAARAGAEAAVLAVLGAPIAVAGMLVNAVPYRLTGWLTALVTVDPVEVATYKVGIGTVLHLAWYALLFLAVAVTSGGVAALAVLAAAPVSGLGTLLVGDRARALAGSYRALRVLRSDSGTATAVAVLRDGIVADLMRMRAEWLSRPGTAAAAAAPGAPGARGGASGAAPAAR
jgi:1-acyl-sn-glycerol-3-phosphate acyltransferase